METKYIVYGRDGEAVRDFDQLRRLVREQVLTEEERQALRVNEVRRDPTSLSADPLASPGVPRARKKLAVSFSEMPAASDTASASGEDGDATAADASADETLLQLLSKASLDDSSEYATIAPSLTSGTPRRHPPSELALSPIKAPRAAASILDESGASAAEVSRITHALSLRSPRLAFIAGEKAYSDRLARDHSVSLSPTTPVGLPESSENAAIAAATERPQTAVGRSRSRPRPRPRPRPQTAASSRPSSRASAAPTTATTATAGTGRRPQSAPATRQRPASAVAASRKAARRTQTNDYSHANRLQREAEEQRRQQQQRLLASRRRDDRKRTAAGKASTYLPAALLGALKLPGPRRSWQQLQSLCAHFRHFGWFQTLSPVVCLELCRVIRVEKFHDEQAVFERGDEQEASFFVVLSGHLVGHRPVLNERTRQIEGWTTIKYTPGHAFGLESVDSGPSYLAVRPLTVVAREPATLVLKMGAREYNKALAFEERMASATK